VSIPYRRQQFLKWCGNNTDFYSELAKQYNTTNNKELWKHYRRTAKLVRICIRRLKRMGVRVKGECKLEDIAASSHSDVLIVIAHKQSLPEAIELWEGAVAPEDFVSAIPENYTGAIDLTCCNSLDLLNLFRLRCPDHKASIGRGSTATADIHITLLPFIVREYLHSDKEYVQVLEETYKQAIDIKKEQEQKAKPVTLGTNNDMSTLFAPRSATAGDQFDVQLYIHRPKDKDYLEIVSRKTDMEKVEEQSLKTKLAKGDKIEVRLRLDNNEDNDFDILGDDVKSTIWDGIHENITFRVNVHNDCKKTKCCCYIQIFINKVRVGEMYFHVNISKNNSQGDPNPAPIDKVKTDEDIRNEAIESIRKMLHERLELKETSDTEKEVINRCLILINSKNFTIGNKNVFISSTGDMTEARHAAQSGINSLEMNFNPILFEYWNTEPIRPYEKCSRKVLQSGYFILLLGPNYGHVEEKLGLSMTRLEYLVAVASGKPILAFIEKNAEKETSGKEQMDFLKKVREDQTVSIFTSADVLMYQVKDALREYVANHKLA